MSEPTAEQIAHLKEKYADRSLHQVEKYAPKDEVVYTFIMTGPTRDELDMFDQRLMKASEIKDAAEKKSAIRSTVEAAALAQIRWPDRDEAKRVLALHPEMVYSFADDIRNFAGANFETRTKKL